MSTEKAITGLAKSIDVSEAPVQAPTEEHSSNAVASLITGPSWTFKQLVEQPRVWTTFDITNQDTNESIYTQAINYSNLFNAAGFAATSLGPDLMNLFSVYKPGIRMTFELCSNFQHVGAAMLLGVPFHDTYANFVWGPGKATQITINQGLQFPHQIITYGHSGTYHLDLDWTGPEEYLMRDDPTHSNTVANFSLNPMNPYGRVHLIAMAPLRVVTGAIRAITVRVWVQLRLEEGLYYPRIGFLNDGV